MLSNFLQSVFAALIVLGPLIAIHEFGHFWMARRMGVKVITYSIGFGRGFIHWNDRHGTRFQIAAIPLGGFVKMVDEREGEVAEADLPYAFNRQSVWKRMAIVAAGPGINLLFGLLLCWLVLLQGEDVVRVVVGKVLPDSPAAHAGMMVGDTVEAVDGQPASDWDGVSYALERRMGDSGVLALKVRGVNGSDRNLNVTIDRYMRETGTDPFRSIGFTIQEPDFDPVISQVVPDSPGARGGMLAGDRVTAADSQAVKSWADFVAIVKVHANKPLPVNVLRQGKALQLTVTPEPGQDEDGHTVGKLGIALDTRHYTLPTSMMQHVDYGPVTAFDKALHRTGDLIAIIPQSIWKMMSGRISTNNLSGPIGLANAARESLDLGWMSLLGFMAFYSVNLGVLNLLPIPVLDGGHLVYYSIEALRRRPLSERAQAFGLQVGLVLLVSLMAFVIVNDVVQKFKL